MSDRLLSAAACAEIAERAEKATAGPWGMFNGFGPVPSDGKHRALYIGQFIGGNRVVEARHDHVPCDLIAAKDDFEFMARAREDIPALLRTVAALREALKPFIEERLRPWTNHCWSCDAILQDRPGHYGTHKPDCPQQRAAAVYAETA